MTQTSTEFGSILVERRGTTGIITLNRPERLNAYHQDMGREIDRALTAFDDDPGVRAIVVTGAGRAFCAGQDLSGDTPFGAYDDDDALADGYGDQGLALDFADLRTPFIAAINGHAVGVGITFPLLADIRIVAEDAKIGFVFVRRGVVAEANAHFVLPKLVGLPNALDLLMTGRMISGREAVELGLAKAAVPADQVLDKALEIADDIGRNTAPTAVAGTRRLAYLSAGFHGAGEAVARESRVFAWMTRQLDATEGIEAFLEKRDPVWRGDGRVPEHILPPVAGGTGG
ncbi:enoyl-CoA hydratase-related protein [Pseudonocardia lacus]|uniref:enoyl-CoA hydratase-related protein n=1 Tax=Pseudonocardia lacus TaxID=2835865 RepID=UPI001BDCEEEC|nr:enoyl-CoA hydratase-related protein [Pseudonocardia lacus]